ncbi:MAG: permease-like cell division protein FtsX [Acidimicrobiales bacterium]
MALSLDYVVRETASNLRRNLLMTAAAILTVFVSLFLVGAALLLRQGVSKATLQWLGGVELSVFMQAGANPGQIDAVKRSLEQMPEVKRFSFVDQEAAFAEFKRMFSGQPDLVDSIKAADLPPSYRVVPAKAEFVDAVGQRFKAGTAGVFEVAYAKEEIDSLLKVTRVLQIGIGAAATVLLVSAALLILNTIQMAIFARRREVAVMKLVGATNWFIRVPFMLEGMLQGLLGAAAAVGVVAVVRNLLAGAVGSNLFGNQLLPRSSDVVGTGVFVLFTGAVIGTVGSAFAVRRFLEV